MELMMLSCDRIQILPPSSFCTLVFHIPASAVWFTHEISLWMVPSQSCCCHPGPVSCHLIPITLGCYQHPKAGKVNPKDARSLDRDSPAPEKTKVTLYPTIIWASAITDSDLQKGPPEFSSFSFFPSFLPPMNIYWLYIKWQTVVQRILWTQTLGGR